MKHLPNGIWSMKWLIEGEVRKKKMRERERKKKKREKKKRAERRDSIVCFYVLD